MIEDTRHNARTETSCWIERTTGVIDTDHFSDEEGKSDADWGNEGSFVLLLRKHEDGEDEFGCQDRLDEDTLHQAGIIAKSSPNVELGREHSKHHT